MEGVNGMTMWNGEAVNITLTHYLACKGLQHLTLLGRDYGSVVECMRKVLSSILIVELLKNGA